MGLSDIPARLTLADALNQRDWHIYYALAMRLILRARDLYTKEPTGLELDAMVYALDSTTIDLCLSLFDWVLFRATRGGGEDAHAVGFTLKVLNPLPAEAGAELSAWRDPDR